MVSAVYFAGHALLLTFIVIGQMIYYDGKKQMPSNTAITISVTLAVVIFLGLATIVFKKEVDCQLCNFLNWLYLLSTIKVLITILKFYPQVMSNYHRKSTQGWNIYGTWLDLTGSVLSILQLVLDCNDQNDWAGVEGNFVKIALGVISGSYDIIFCIQHYIIYPGTGDDAVLKKKKKSGGSQIELSYSQLDSTEHGMDDSVRRGTDDFDLAIADDEEDDIEEVYLQDDNEEGAYFSISN